MAGNTYRIIIEAGGEGNATGKAPIAEVTQSSAPRGNSDITASAKQKASAVKNIALGALSTFANYAHNLQMQEINIVTGQTQLAQRRQLGQSIVNSSLNIVQSGVSGGMIASFLGISGPTGWIIGGVTAVAKFGMNYYAKSNELSLKQYVEDEQINALRTRAGATFNRSRLG